MLVEVAKCREGLMPALGAAHAWLEETISRVEAARSERASAQGRIAGIVSLTRGLQPQIAGLLSQMRTAEEQRRTAEGRAQLQTLVLDTLE